MLESAINIEYQFIQEENKFRQRKFINVSYRLKVDAHQNWKEKLKKDICNIIDNNESLMYIRIGV